MNKKITVTAKDIAKGKREDSGACPVYHAIRRAIPKSTYVEVGLFAIGWKHQERHWHWVLPRDISLKINEYDSGLKMKPFSFVIPLSEVKGYKCN